MYSFALGELPLARFPYIGNGNLRETEWERGEKGIFHPHTHGPSDLLLSDFQTDLGCCTGQRCSVVWELPGVGYRKAKRQKERDRRIPLKGKRVKSGKIRHPLGKGGLLVPPVASNIHQGLTLATGHQFSKK